MKTKNIKIKQITSMVHKQKVGLNPSYVTFLVKMDGISGLDKEKGDLLRIHMNMKEDIRGYAAHLKYDFAPAPELHRISDLALRKRNFLRL